MNKITSKQNENCTKIYGKSNSRENYNRQKEVNINKRMQTKIRDTVEVIK